MEELLQNRGALAGLLSPETLALLNEQYPENLAVENQAPQQEFPTDAQFNALMQVENAPGDPNAVSPAGAVGLTQLMPATAAEMATQLGLDPNTIDLTNPDVNKRLGRAYLAKMGGQFHDPILNFAAYNAGPGRVQQAIAKAGTNDPNVVVPMLPPETRAYIPKIQAAGGLPSQAQSQSQDSSVAAPNQSRAGQMTQAFEQQKEAATAGAGEYQDAITKQAEAERAQADVAQQQLKEEQLRQQEGQRLIAEGRKKYDQAFADYSSGKIDPNRFYGNLSTGNKILAAISIAVGGFSQGLRGGGGNIALDLITKAIDNDIAIQEKEIDQKGKTAQREASLFQDLLQQYGNPVAARAALRGLQLDAAKAVATSYATLAKGASEKANAEKTIAGIEVEKQKELANLDKAALDQPGAFGAEARQVLSGQKPLIQASEKVRKTVVPGLGVAASEEDKAKIEKAREAHSKLMFNINSMIKSRQQKGLLGGRELQFPIWDADEIKTQSANAKDALLQLKELNNLGALQKYEQQILEEIIPSDPTSWNLPSAATGNDPVMAKLNRLREFADQVLKNAVEPRLIEKVSDAPLSLVPPESEASYGTPQPEWKAR